MDLQRLKIDRSRRTAPSRRPRWLLPAGSAATALALLWLFAGPLGRGLDRLRLPRVRVAEVAQAHPATAGAVSGTAANGHVVAARRAALSTDLPGRIVELRVTEGSFVREGDLVARLFSEDAEAALASAQARLDGARAAVERVRASERAARASLAGAETAREAARARAREAEASAALASSDLARIRRLVGEGVLADRDLDVATSQQAQAAARLDSARADERSASASVDDAAARRRLAESEVVVAQAELEATEAERDRAAALLTKTEVRAPFDGVVVLKDAEIGEVVSPASTGGSTARGSVCTLVDLDSLEVQADVPETSLAAVRLEGPVSIFLDARPEREYAGRVTRIWPTANRQKATIEVRARFEEPDEELRPEMGVRIVFLAPGAQPRGGDGEGGPALLVSESALVRAGGGAAVWVLERDRVGLRPITVGERRGGRVSVESGLEAGERVVLDPPPGLEDGDRVLVEGA